MASHHCNYLIHPSLPTPTSPQSPFSVVHRKLSPQWLGFHFLVQNCCSHLHDHHNCHHLINAQAHHHCHLISPHSPSPCPTVSCSTTETEPQWLCLGFLAKTCPSPCTTTVISSHVPIASLHYLSHHFRLLTQACPPPHICKWAGLLPLPDITLFCITPEHVLGLYCLVPQFV